MPVLLRILIGTAFTYSGLFLLTVIVRIPQNFDDRTDAAIQHRQAIAQRNELALNLILLHFIAYPTKGLTRRERSRPY